MIYNWRNLNATIIEAVLLFSLIGNGHWSHSIKNVEDANAAFAKLSGSVSFIVKCSFNNLVS